MRERLSCSSPPHSNELSSLIWTWNNCQSFWQFLSHTVCNWGNPFFYKAIRCTWKFGLGTRQVDSSVVHHCILFPLQCVRKWRAPVTFVGWELSSLPAHSETKWLLAHSSYRCHLMCDHVPRHKGGTLLAYPTTVASFTSLRNAHQSWEGLWARLHTTALDKMGRWVGKYSVTGQWVHSEYYNNTNVYRLNSSLSSSLCLPRSLQCTLYRSLTPCSQWLVRRERERAS